MSAKLEALSLAVCGGVLDHWRRIMELIGGPSQEVSFDDQCAAIRTALRIPPNLMASATPERLATMMPGEGTVEEKIPKLYAALVQAKAGTGGASSSAGGRPAAETPSKPAAEAPRKPAEEPASIQSSAAAVAGRPDGSEHTVRPSQVIRANLEAVSATPQPPAPKQRRKSLVEQAGSWFAKAREKELAKAQAEAAAAEKKQAEAKEKRRKEMEEARKKKAEADLKAELEAEAAEIAAEEAAEKKAAEKEAMRQAAEAERVKQLEEYRKKHEEERLAEEEKRKAAQAEDEAARAAELEAAARAAKEAREAAKARVTDAPKEAEKEALGGGVFRQSSRQSSRAAGLADGHVLGGQLREQTEEEKQKAAEDFEDFLEKRRQAAQLEWEATNEARKAAASADDGDQTPMGMAKAWLPKGWLS